MNTKLEKTIKFKLGLVKYKGTVSLPVLIIIMIIIIILHA